MRIHFFGKWRVTANELWSLRSWFAAGRRTWMEVISCGYGSGLVPGHPWALSDVGPGPFVSSLVRTCGPDDYYASSCPPSLVFSLLMGNSTRLVRCFPCLSRASTDDIRAALLLVGGLEPCALFLATYFVTDVTLCQAVDFCLGVADLGPELPGLEDTIKDSLEVKIGIYTRLIEFANFCIPLSRFLLCVLQYYQINFSQLFVLAATKIDAYVCPIFVPWYNDVSVKKDPLPYDDIVEFELLEKLDNNHTLIKKYLDTFLCLVGLSRSFSDPTAHPTLLCCDKSDIETADIVINHSPQTVRLVTHTIADELNVHSGKNKRKVGSSNSPSPVKKARTGGVSIKEHAATTVGKSPSVIQKLITQSGHAPVNSGAGASCLDEFVSSSVTLTPEHGCEDESISNHDDNVRTCPLSGRYVVLSSSSAKTGILTSQVVSPVSSVQANVDIVDTKPVGEAHGLSVPRGGWGTVRSSERGGTSSAVPNQGSFVDDFYVSQTIESTTSHNVYVPNWDVTNNAQIDDPRDAKIVELRSKLEKAKGEIADASVWFGIGDAKLKEQFKAMQDDAVWCLVDRSSALDARLSELSYQVDSELYPHMLTTVTGRRWVIGHGLAFMKCCGSLEYQTALGKVGRDLSMVEAYDPRVKARYEVAIGELENISLPFLTRLASCKDAPLDRVMAALYFEGFPNVENEMPVFRKLQPILEEALEASLARARKHKRAASLSLPFVVQEQGASSSLVVAAIPLNSIDVDDYTISDVSMLRIAMDSELQNLSFVDNQQVPSNDEKFYTALLDKPVDP
ncbi:hypothetical protein Tco_0474409 [Tanacetum coccineum]